MNIIPSAAGEGGLQVCGGRGRDTPAPGSSLKLAAAQASANVFMTLFISIWSTLNRISSVFSFVF